MHCINIQCKFHDCWSSVFHFRFLSILCVCECVCVCVSEYVTVWLVWLFFVFYFYECVYVCVCVCVWVLKAQCSKINWTRIKGVTHPFFIGTVCLCVCVCLCECDCVSNVGHAKRRATHFALCDIDMSRTLKEKQTIQLSLLAGDPG